MAVLKNRAGVLTSTTGTGTITLGTAIGGGVAINTVSWQTFAGAGVANGDSVRYLIFDSNGNWEYGPGTYTSSGTTLSRAAGAMDGTVSGQKSSSGALLSLSGTAQVFITALAEDLLTTTDAAATYLTTATASLTYAPLTSPVFVGNPTAPTASSADNDTTVATTAFVKSQNYVTTTTLGNYATTAFVTTALTSYLPKSGGTVENLTVSPGALTANGGITTSSLMATGTVFAVNTTISNAVTTSTFNASSNASVGGTLVANGSFMIIQSTNPRLLFHDAGVSYKIIENTGGGLYMGASDGNVIVSPYMALDSLNRFIVPGEAYKPGGGAWADGSDQRIKTVIGEYTTGLEKIRQLSPIRYKFKGNDTPQAPADGDSVPYKMSGHRSVALLGEEHIGLVAQAVESVVPEMVTKQEAWIDGQKVDDLRILDTSSLVYALVNAVQELAARIETLEAK